MSYDRAHLRLVLNADLKANGLERWRIDYRFRRPEVHYLRLMRKLEFLTGRAGVYARVRRAWTRFRFMNASVRTGLSIPPGVAGPGLGVAHYGYIVVHSRARLGSWCRLVSGINIGVADGGVPTLGDRVYVAAGAVLYGNIHVGDRAVIGANAVVGRDVPPGVTVAGAPARVISERGSDVLMPTWMREA